MVFGNKLFSNYSVIGGYLPCAQVASVFEFHSVFLPGFSGFRTRLSRQIRLAVQNTKA